jgi:hypothetical protein
VITGVIGVALSFLGPYMVPPVPPTPWSSSTWSPEVAWHRVLGPAIGWWQWWLGYAIVTVSMRMSRLARKLNRIDLLDLSPLAPFTQQGLTNALLVIGLLSIYSLMLLETGFGGAVLAIHNRIRQAKDSELRRINGAISTQRSALEDPDASRRIGEMVDLVAYRGLIEGVPEWPFTTSTYTRFILYMLIPVASWVLGGVAEEIVGRALF